MATHQNHDLHVSKFQAPQQLKTISYGLLAFGALISLVGLIKFPERVWPAYLVAFFFFSCLGVGGLFFAALQHVVKAGWSVSVRRCAEAMTSFIPVIFIGGLVLGFVGMKYLYPWANPEEVASNPIIAAKTGYLNVGSFIIRLVLFAGGWFAFKWVIVGNSIHQDQDGNEKHTTQNVGLSVAFILFFAISFSLFCVDLLMSILPSWYSTIFGIYCFSGLFQATFAVLAIVTILLRKSGLVKGYLTDEHQHDIAKFLKGFTVFWAYIAFSQFMLIWYANIPEETEFYIMRSLNGWLGISMLLLIFRFIVPFLVLLPRGAKRDSKTLMMVSILILVMQYVDIWWMVYPNYFDGQVTFGIWEIGTFALFAGAFLMGIMSFFSKFSLVPLRDPRLQETISHHVTY